MDWNSFVYFTMDERKLKRAGKTTAKGKKKRTRRKLVLEIFIGAKLMAVYIQTGQFTQNRSFLFVHSETS